MRFQERDKNGSWCKKYFWTEEKLQFLRDNYATMMQREIADHLKMPRTTVKNKAMQLGLRKIAVIMKWSEEQEKFLLDHLEICSNPELVQKMKEKWPEGNFTICTIKGKLARMQRFRSEQQQKVFMRSFCPATNLDDRWVARCICGRKMHLYNQVLQQPQLIELKKQQLILKRIIHDTQSKTIS